MNEQQVRELAVQVVVDLWKQGCIGYTTMVLSLERLPSMKIEAGIAA